VFARLIMLVAMQGLLHQVVGNVRPSFDGAVWRQLQASAWPLGFFMIALNMYSYIDTVILGLIRTDSEVGWYAASYRVYEGLTYAPSILAAVVTPRLSYLFRHDRKAHRRLLRRFLMASVALGVVLGVGVAFAARFVVVALFGSRYLAAASPLQVLTAGALFVCASWILHAAAISTDLDRQLFLTTITGLSTNVVLNIMWIPGSGIVGAAWATVVAEALTVVLLFVQVERRLRSA
jgi:O-antigen/teichoic acid export membrane protein